MGRITMFTREGCSHCVRAKTELEGRSLPFVEISLTDFPERRQDMMALSNRMTVPQIFFNSDSIGGADDLMAKLAEWDRTGLFRETYRKLVERLPDPTDPRLAVPTYHEEVSELSTTGYESPEEEEMMDFGCISLPNGTCAGIQEVTRRLVDRMPRQKLPYLTKFYSDCFPGSRGVDALLELYFSDAGEEQEENRRAKAVVFGRLLQKHGVLHHVCDDHLFHDTDAYYYRLQPFHEPNVLNSAVSTLVSMQQQKEDEEPQQTSLLSPKGALKVLNKLNNLLAEIEQKASTREGIDYLSIDNPLYHRLEDYASQLQCMDPSTLSSTGGMTQEERFVFWIHLYNIMNRHANLKVGIPTTSAQRGAFFTSVTYNIAGHLVTLDDVEHGILRANTRHPYHLKPQFSSADDPRKIWVLPTPLDPRLHFTLFCGAKSCPPINTYTPDNLEEELQIVTQAFCQEDTNVLVDEATNTLSLSMIFKWYRTDFGCSSVKELPALILSFLPQDGDKHSTLKRMMEDASNNKSGGIFGNRSIKRTGSSGSLSSVGKGIKVKFLPYDWSSNAAPGKFVEFQRAKLKTKSAPSLRATFSRSASFTGGGCIPPVTKLSPSSSASGVHVMPAAKSARRPPVKQPSTTTTTTTSSPTSTRALLTREHQLLEEDGEEGWQSLFDVEEALVTEVWV